MSPKSFPGLFNLLLRVPACAAAIPAPSPAPALFFRIRFTPFPAGRLRTRWLDRDATTIPSAAAPRVPSPGLSSLNPAANRWVA